MRKLALLAVLLAFGAGFSESASAGGRARVSVGFAFGGPFWYPAPWYYAPPYYYSPPQVVYSSPPVYIERQDAAEERSADWWYYCDQSKAYYPYVKTCPTGWQKVAPAPQE
jgi:hypothetical protein